VDGYQVNITPLGLPAVGAGWSGNIPDGVVQPERDVMAQVTVSAVPEPSTFALLGAGCLGLLGLAWRKRRRAG
jgi:hypothetical protein